MNFPKAVAKITALPAQFRAAAAELDALATAAPAVELGRLRRQVNTVRVQVALALDSEEVSHG